MFLGGRRAYTPPTVKSPGRWHGPSTGRASSIRTSTGADSFRSAKVSCRTGVG